jgi:16S rRNA processing protein RimM
VGRAHGYDGSFYVDAPQHALAPGTEVELGGERRRVERRAGTDSRPLVRLEGVGDARPLHGETLLVEAELAEGEWLAADLVGCRVEGMGEVARVIEAPSCDLLELDDGTLVPFVSDAILAVNTEAGTIKANAGWLGAR